MLMWSSNTFLSCDFILPIEFLLVGHEFSLCKGQEVEALYYSSTTRNSALLYQEISSNSFMTHEDIILCKQ